MPLLHSYSYVPSFPPYVFFVYFLLFFSLVFLCSLLTSCCSFFPLVTAIHYAQLRPFYIACCNEFYCFIHQLFLAQCGCPSKTTHRFVGCSAIAITLYWLCQVPFLDKRVLFSCSQWHSYLDKGWVFSFTNSYGMHLVIPAHISLFWVVCHPNKTFSSKELEWEPKNQLPLLPTTRPYPLLPLTHGPLRLHWLSTSRGCLSLVHAPLSCESMACLLFMRLPWPGGLSGLCYMFCCSFLTSCGVNESLGLHSLYLISLFELVWVQAFLPSVWPLSFFTSGLWVSQCSYHVIPLLLPCYYSTCACWAFFGPAMHFSFIQFMLLIVFCWVNPYTILGFLGPFYSIGHPWPIPFLHSHELLLCLFGFPGLTTIFFTFEACWPLYQPHLLILFFGLLRPIFAFFLLLIIPMSLLLPFLGSLGPVCFL